MLDVLGMTAPTEVGGRGFTQLAYTKIIEIIGGHCASTAVFVRDSFALPAESPVRPLFAWSAVLGAGVALR